MPTVGQHLPINHLAVLVAAAVIFMLGGLWYSPALFARRWVALMGKSEAEMKAAAGAMPVMYLVVFACGLATAWVLSAVIAHVAVTTAAGGALVAAACWLGFAAATSFGTALFSAQPKQLWLINSGYNLVAFVVAGIILAVWR